MSGIRQQTHNLDVAQYNKKGFTQCQSGAFKITDAKKKKTNMKHRTEFIVTYFYKVHAKWASAKINAIEAVLHFISEILFWAALQTNKLQ